MKYLKKFGKFAEAAAAPATKPAPSTTPAPTVDPGTKPERRDRPTPVRRDRPAAEPDPQAKLKKAKVQDVIENFLTISREEGFNFKKYFPKA
jgi:hypothetical protein